MNNVFKKGFQFFCVGLLFISLFSCSVKRPHIWVEELPKEESEPLQYRIAPGNQLMVSVWGQDQISGTQLVREDGNISVVLVGDINVAGLTTEEAADAIAKRLEGDIVQNVRVDVSVVATVPQFVTVIGEVGTQGKIELLSHDNLIDVIAKSGGFTEFAHTDQMYVIRKKKNDELQVIRFDFDRMTSCPNAGINFRLHDGDIVVVD
ncbi:MAG: polysaccharide export protein [Deltaproteobacteria bacterium]|nr:polysaccharide export protein [Deltaproteobacteria bacterium]